jgi:hypothetical protein
MSKQSFLSALAWQLTLAGVPYVRPDLEAFVDDVWSLAEDDPEVTRWADAFAKALSAAPGETADRVPTERGWAG